MNSDFARRKNKNQEIRESREAGKNMESREAKKRKEAKKGKNKKRKLESVEARKQGTKHGKALKSIEKQRYAQDNNVRTTLHCASLHCLDRQSKSHGLEPQVPHWAACSDSRSDTREHGARRWANLSFQERVIH